MKIALRVVFLGLILGFQSAGRTAQAEVPILQGATSTRETQFTVLRSSHTLLTYEIVAPDFKSVKITPRETLGYPGSGFVVDKLWVDGLRPGTTYQLHVYDPSLEPEYAMEDSRNFRTMEEKNGKNLRFAMVSCMSDEAGFLEGPMWRALRDSEPEVIFYMGDNVYADRGHDGTPLGIWTRYVETRIALDIFFFRDLIPSVATWDDHDYGKDNADQTFPFKGEASKIFHAFFGNYPVQGYQTGPGVSSVYQIYGHRFFLMDDRSFRDPEGQPRGSHWGLTQENWLFSKLSEQTMPTFLFNGSEFFGAYQDEESYERQHPESFAAMLGRLKLLRSPIVFGSGDIHYSELMRIEPELLGYETAELVSSSMHSFTYPGIENQFVNPRRLNSTWKHNFLLVDSVATGPTSLRLDVQSIDGAIETIFQRQFTIRSR